jgi:hypothetical protein
VISED